MHTAQPNAFILRGSDKLIIIICYFDNATDCSGNRRAISINPKPITKRCVNDFAGWVTVSLGSSTILFFTLGSSTFFFFFFTTSALLLFLFFPRLLDVIYRPSASPWRSSRSPPDRWRATDASQPVMGYEPRFLRSIAFAEPKSSLNWPSRTRSVVSDHELILNGLNIPPNPNGTSEKFKCSSFEMQSALFVR